VSPISNAFDIPELPMMSIPEGCCSPARARVLLADDHADVAEQLRAILESDFDVVATVGDGAALLAAADALRPDVIVTDISMPGMDGLEATARIVDRTPGARVVIVTIQDEPAIQRRGIAAGALGYVVKFTADLDLVPAVHAALRGERYEGTRLSR
jgi:DNA-binding NarL/FixJ family response regulator